MAQNVLMLWYKYIRSSFHLKYLLDNALQDTSVTRQYTMQFPCREFQSKPADAAAKALFSNGTDSADMPSTEIASDDLQDGKIGILTLLVKTGICTSNRDARTLVTQNAISVNDEKFTDPKGLIDLSEPVIIKKGKKVFHKVYKA